MEAESNYIYCEGCRKRKKQLKENRILLRKCVNCHKPIRERRDGKKLKLCYKCSEKNKKRRKANVKALKAQRRCVECAKPLEKDNNTTVCAACGEKKYIRHKNRRKNNIEYRLRQIFSHSILTALIYNNTTKQNKSMLSCLPYSILELRKYLESLFEPWMNWKNHGNYKFADWDDNDQSTWTWHIDHIIPVSAFTFTSMEDKEFQKCWALSNLRPLSAKENIKKGNKIIEEK